MRKNIMHKNFFSLILVIFLIVITGCSTDNNHSETGPKDNFLTKSVNLKELPKSEVNKLISDANKDVVSFEYESVTNYTIISTYGGTNSTTTYYGESFHSVDFAKKEMIIDSVSKNYYSNREDEITRVHQEYKNDTVTTVADGVSTTKPIGYDMWPSRNSSKEPDEIDFTFEPDESYNGQSYYVLKVYDPGYAYNMVWGYSVGDSEEERQELADEIKDMYIYKIWINKISA